MEGKIKWTCSQFAEHNGETAITGPVAHWQPGCQCCNVEVIEGPFRIVWTTGPFDPEFSVVPG